MIQMIKKIKEEEQRIQAAQTDFEASRKKIQSLVRTNRVSLNIGGHVFQTTRQTLSKQPNSMLSAMFSGQNEDIMKPDENGNYFIDRDPTHFQTILNFLRTNEMIWPESTNERRKLQLELDFYCILEPTNTVDSVLVTKEHIEFLCNCLKKNVSFQLLYRASLHGFEKYASMVIGNSLPRIYLFKTQLTLFGAYSTIDTNGELNRYYTDANAFIFTLINTLNKPPEMYPVRVYENARYQRNNFIIDFGGGGDLYIDTNQKKGYTNFPCYYSHPTFKSYTEGCEFLGGCTNFNVVDIEVFLVCG